MLTLNPANIFAAVVGGVQGVIASFGVGGQLAVDGIVAAQTTLATALAARPVPIPLASASPRAARSAAANATSTGVVSTSRQLAARTVQRDSAAADVATSSPKTATAPGKRAARAGAAF